MKEKAEHAGQAAEPMAQKNADQAAEQQPPHHRSTEAVEEAWALECLRLAGRIVRCRIGRHRALDRCGRLWRRPGRRDRLESAHAATAEAAATARIGVIHSDHGKCQEQSRNQNCKPS
ncbi:hypothetical protein [Mesorhizobium sp. M1217]|uniref:hypothetical protein n=1 Tax=Mesorhizobium sp. M1217 TaxID=2957070 RepID=UPI0033381E15